MFPSLQPSARLARFHLPLACLVACLQRTPVLRVAATFAERTFASSAGAVLRTLAIPAASLGAVDSLAGATTLVTNKPSPLALTAGTAMAPVAFGVNGPGVGQPGSWVVEGTVPPGLGFSGLTASGTVNVANLVLTGTPAVPGSYTVTLQGWEDKNRRGKSSPVYPYLIVVAAAVAPDVAPVITAPPAGLTVAAGAAATLTVSATGTPAPTYQWHKDGTALAGATAPTFALAAARAADAGLYTVVVANSAGTVSSCPATLVVSVPPPTVPPAPPAPPAAEPGRLVNLSVLTRAGPGADLLTMGAAIGGARTAGNLPLVIRAVGPSLSAFGVAGPLSDPLMTVNAQGVATPIASNDNWDSSAPTRTAFAAVGAFALPDASLDCAYVPPSPGLRAGAYTVQVGATGSGSGLVIAEIYDAAGSSRNASTPRLVNLSTLARIGDAATLAVGFVVGGNGPCTVVVRAVGPTLAAAFGLGGAMADPVLVLFSNDSGREIAGNDDWGGSAGLAAAMGTVGAFPLGDAASRDAALVVTLPPGAYSARVSGQAGLGGLALVEVYEQR